MTNKEINRKIAELAGDAEVFNIKPLFISDEDLKFVGKHYTKFREYNDYSTDLNVAIDAAKRIADKNNYTFVLTYLSDDGAWKASFGNYVDCAEDISSDPAHCTCICILKFMGQL